MIAGALAFILSPLGRIAVIALAIFAAVAFIDRRATYRERARCETAALIAKLAAKDTDLAAANEAAAAAQAAAAESDRQAKDNERKVADYADELKKRPNGACALTADDLAPDNPAGGLRERAKRRAK